MFVGGNIKRYYRRIIKLRDLGITKRYLFIYCIFTIVPIIINALWIIVLREFRGEFQYSTLPVLLRTEDILFLLLMGILFFIVSYFVYQTLNSKRIIISTRYMVSVNRKRLEFYIILMIAINFLLYVTTGIGKAGGAYQQKSWTFLIYFWNYDFFFWIYYYRYAKQRTKKYTFIVILFCLFQFVQGWTAFVFNIFLSEVFIRCDSKKFSFKAIFLTPLFFLGGSALYTLMYPLKFWIRTGNLKWITFIDGVLRLSERLSFFSYSAVAVQNKDIVLDLFYDFNSEYGEAMSFFYPWVPSFLLPNKSMRLLNNVVMLSAYPNFGTDTSAGLGFAYPYLLKEMRIPILLLFGMLVALYIFINKILIDNLAVNDECGYNFSSYMFFLVVLNIFNGYTFRRIGTYVPVLWTLIMLFLFKVIIIKRK